MLAHLNEVLEHLEKFEVAVHSQSMQLNPVDLATETFWEWII